ncbi:erythromycin esterase [Saccharibacillus sp. O23]|uniref:erythromycin esterase family protein n=1 Tax=Saccharibacillus sp. O23 TaxID=2009338 RepID=UPI000B4E2BD8|nr:erythromycin esterase family protein [Saccharibacillus sp. O23]OWR30412.1 erythromycin esterase [Saccharibacillus sp. O23]
MGKRTVTIQKRSGRISTEKRGGERKSFGFARIAVLPLAAALLSGAAVSPTYAESAGTSGIDAAAAAKMLKDAAQAQEIRKAAKPQQAEWMRANMHALDQDGEKKADFGFLKPILGDKRVVALGENFHQIGDYSRIKIELIKFMHEKLGYDVIAFESGMGEAAAAWAFRDDLDAKTMMQGSIFGVWHSEETLELFEYIREQAKTDHPLILTGYDMQFGSALSSQLVAGLLQAADREKAQTFMQSDLEAMTELYAAAGSGEGEPNDKTQAALADVEKKYAPLYEAASALLKRKEAAVRASVPGQPELYDIAQRTLSDRIAFMRMMRMGVQESYEYRDRLMAENAEWLMNDVYPGKKMILWAHNDHLAKKGSAMSLLENGKWIAGFKDMGELLHERLGDDLYVVGLYANRGSGLEIGSDRPFSFGPMPEDSLENLLSLGGYGRAFIDLDAAPASSPYGAWIDKPISAGEDGLTSTFVSPMNIRFVPREQYDGLIFADEVSAPTRLKP